MKVRPQSLTYFSCMDGDGLQFLKTFALDVCLVNKLVKVDFSIYKVIKVEIKV